MLIVSQNQSEQMLLLRIGVGKCAAVFLETLQDGDSVTLALYKLFTYLLTYCGSVIINTLLAELNDV